MNDIEFETLNSAMLTPDGRVKVVGTKTVEKGSLPMLYVKPPKTGWPNSEPSVVALSENDIEEAVERGKRFCKENEEEIYSLGEDLVDRPSVPVGDYS